MIAKTSIDAVFEAARIEEVIGEFVQLKKSGANYKGLSPFTHERSPSFMVSPAKQIWKDFSSGKGGNVAAFLMEHEQFTYPEAIRYLAKKYAIELEETQQRQEDKALADERESIYLALEFAQQYFHETLLHTEPGKAIGLSYFTERGFTKETIQKFKLGYSPDEWDLFTREALAKGYQLSFLEKAGLTIVKDERRFDRFKGRALFPIHSMSGRVLGFGGRILTNDKKAAKYINSPESEVYQKSKILYGIHLAKKAIAKEDSCYLVEGYTDVIQFHQAGIENVVASGGTSLTPEQIRLVRRLTRNLTVLFDGDAAGLRAALRGIDLVLEEGMNVRVCTFPDGEDPDSFARKNSFSEVQAYLRAHTQDFIQFKTSLLVEETKKDPIKRAEIIHDIVSSISKIPDAIRQELYVKECARLMDVSEQALFNTLAQLQKKAQADHAKKYKEAAPVFEVIKTEKERETVNEQQELERKIIELLLLYGDRVEDFEDMLLKTDEAGKLVLEPEVHRMRVVEKVFLDLQQDEIALSNPVFMEIYTRLVNALNQPGVFSIEHFVNQLEGDAGGEVTSILMEAEKYHLHEWSRRHVYVKGKEESVAQLVSETILNLRCHLIHKQVERLQRETLKKEDTQEILEEITQYHQLKKLLAKKLNRVI